MTNNTPKSIGEITRALVDLEYGIDQTYDGLGHLALRTIHNALCWAYNIHEGCCPPLNKCRECNECHNPVNALIATAQSQRLAKGFDELLKLKCPEVRK